MTTADITNWRAPRGRVAALSRSRATDDPDLVRARTDLRVARLAEHIQRTVEAAPPLSTDQRARLMVLLGGGADDAA